MHVPKAQKRVSLTGIPTRLSIEMCGLYMNLLPLCWHVARWFYCYLRFVSIRRPFLKMRFAFFLTRRNVFVADFVLERTRSETPKNFASKSLKWNVRCQILFEWTYEVNLVNWRGSLKNKFEFRTIVSRTLQSQYGRIRCHIFDRNLECFFLTFHAQFLFILDNV